jgi:predicted transcriptional regulator
MLVIGFRDSDNAMSSKEIDIEATDSPRKIHDLLKKETGMDYSRIVLIEDDTVVAEFTDQEDYDLSVDDEEDIDNDDGSDLNFDD